jgi:hypothetical protein
VLEDEFAPLADLAELVQHGGALRGVGGRAFRRSTDIFLISASAPSGEGKVNRVIALQQVPYEEVLGGGPRSR